MTKSVSKSLTRSEARVAEGTIRVDIIDAADYDERTHTPILELHAGRVVRLGASPQPARRSRLAVLVTVVAAADQADRLPGVAQVESPMVDPERPGRLSCGSRSPAWEITEARRRRDEPSRYPL